MAHTLYVDFIVDHTLYVDYIVAPTLYVDARKNSLTHKVFMCIIFKPLGVFQKVNWRRSARNQGL